MSLKIRTLQTILLVLGGFALVAAVPARGQDDEKDRKGEPVKPKGDDDKAQGAVSPGGPLKKYTGFT